MRRRAPLTRSLEVDAISSHSRLYRASRRRRFRNTRGDWICDASPGTARRARGNTAMSGYSSLVMVRARILRCRARYVGALGSTAAFGDHRALPDITESHVPRRGGRFVRLVRALGFAHAHYLLRAICYRLSPEGHFSRRALGGPSIRR